MPDYAGYFVAVGGDCDWGLLVYYPGISGEGGVREGVHGCQSSLASTGLIMEAEDEVEVRGLE